MQKNWYAVYTRINCEKKVSSLLTKRKIENFCPLNEIRIKSIKKNKIAKEPLFKSYVFARVSHSEIKLVRQIDEVISILFWMGKPAIIKDEEINLIKDFTNDHYNIELERTHVDVINKAHVLDNPVFSMEGNVFALKNKILKVNLPSLGYMMVAKMEEESIFGREATIIQNNSFSHS